MPKTSFNTEGKYKGSDTRMIFFFLIFQFFPKIFSFFFTRRFLHELYFHTKGDVSDLINGTFPNQHFTVIVKAK